VGARLAAFAHLSMAPSLSQHLTNRAKKLLDAYFEYETTKDPGWRIGVIAKNPAVNC